MTVMRAKMNMQKIPPPILAMAIERACCPFRITGSIGGKRICEQYS